MAHEPDAAGSRLDTHDSGPHGEQSAEGSSSILYGFVLDSPPIRGPHRLTLPCPQASKNPIVRVRNTTRYDIVLVQHIIDEGTRYGWISRDIEKRRR